MPTHHSIFKSFASLCSFGVLLLYSQGLLAAPVAMVTDVQGTLEIKGQPLALLAELDENTEIDLPPESQLTLVYYASGQEYKASGPLKLALKQDAPQGDGQALAGVTLMAAAESTRLAAADHSQAAVIMRAPAKTTSELILQYPAWSNILEPAPIFSWKTASGQDKDYSYQLEILDNKGKVLFTGQSDIGRLRLPKDLELPKGERLSWELEAKSGEQILFGRADFQIAEDTKVAQVDQMAKDLGQDFGRRLIFVRYLKANGFQHAADELWQNLVSERPELAGTPSP